MFLSYFSIRSLAFTILSAFSAKSPRPVWRNCLNAEIAEKNRRVRRVYAQLTLNADSLLPLVSPLC
jgi:hypothetical protein